jgi:hypothetical protein
LFWKTWSRHAWLQAMQVLMSARALRRLVDELGVGEQRARHRHHVGRALGDDALGHLRRVDAVGA